MDRYNQEQEQFARIIFASQGHKLPETKKQGMTATEFRAFAHDHNLTRRENGG